MDGIANASRQQQPKVSGQEAQGRVSQQMQQTQQAETKKVDVVKQMQKEVSQTTQKINSKEQAQELVNQLNNAMAPMNTSLRFGFDNTSDVFFVSVIESESSKLIRRFPAEQAMDFLPKMQEVTGLLFDSKG